MTFWYCLDLSLQILPFASVNLCEIYLQIESRDPASGVLYYYNEKSGKSQWERPIEVAVNTELPSSSPSPLPEDWQEVLDETTGMQSE